MSWCDKSVGDLDYADPDRAVLMCLYAKRPCGICGEPEWCRHREPDVDLAALASRRERRKIA